MTAKLVFHVTRTPIPILGMPRDADSVRLNSIYLPELPQGQLWDRLAETSKDTTDAKD